MSTSQPASAPSPDSRQASPKRWRRRVWRSGKLLLVALFAYALLVVVGTLPVNRDWRNPRRGIEVFVYADLVHSELSVPRVSEVVDWNDWFKPSDFEQGFARKDYLGIGWGDREFFLTTPTWDDARASVVAGALLWPSGTVMHVSLRDKPKEGEFHRRIVLTPEQYEELVTHIQESFALGQDSLPQLIGGYSFNGNDAFYEAKGYYSLFYTCNNWTGDALKKAGVRTGLWTPYPWGLFQPAVE